MIRVFHDSTTDKKAPEITEEVAQELVNIQRKFGMTDDGGFVQDLWIALQTKGRMMQGRKYAVKRNVNKLTKEGHQYGDSYKRVTRHYSFFFRLRKLAHFQKLCDVKDTFDAVERLLGIFKKLSAKTQPATCNACSLAKQCSFGKQFMAEDAPANFDPAKIDYTKKIRDDCPEVPNMIDPLAVASKAIAILIVLVDPIQGAGAVAELQKGGKDSNDAAGLLLVMQQAGSINMSGGAGAPPTPGSVGYFDATFTGDKMLDGLEKMVENITSKQLAVFELARAFNETLIPGDSEEKEDVEYIAHDQRVREMRTPDEMSRALPGDLVDDDNFEKKVAYGEVRVRQDIERRKKKQYFLILLDVSGSMAAGLGANSYGLHTRGSLAAALCLSVIKKVQVERGVMLFRFFADAPDRLRRAEDFDAMADLTRIIGLSNYDGGGTHIMAALAAAVKDIAEEEKKGKGKAEILLISDGESMMDPKLLETWFGNPPGQVGKPMLHVLDVSPGTPLPPDAPLHKYSAPNYLKIDPNQIDFRAVASKAATK